MKFRFKAPPIYVLITDTELRVSECAKYPNGRVPIVSKPHPVAGFDHPRVVVGSSKEATSTVGALWEALMAQIPVKSFIRPVCVVHVIRTLEGGMTDMERRCLTELFLTAHSKLAVRKVIICERPHKLSDRELESVLRTF